MPLAIDTLIHARWIIPIEPFNSVYTQHSIAVHNGLILEILPTTDAQQKYCATDTLTLSEHALIPGLINCHTHAAMSLMRGIADDLPLMDWLQQHIWPLEQRWMSAEWVTDGTDLAIAEMLRGGITCFNDMYFFPDIVAQRALQYGMRASVGLIVIDFPTVWAQNSEEYLAKGLALHQQLTQQELVTTTLAPHAPYTVSDAPLQHIRQLASELKLPVHIHVHETAAEITQQLQQTGQRPLQRLQQLGLVNEQLLAVHMTQLEAHEIKLLAASGSHIVHCPESNLKLASGFCPVAACLAAGVNIALGTDGAASNNDLDLLGEMRTAALLAKGVTGDASAIPAYTALTMATLNGAKALGIADKTGSLVPGKAADITALRLDELETRPLFDPVSQIVYAASRQQVTDVWVAGKHLLKQRQLTTLDINALYSRVDKWQQRLQANATGH